MRLCHIVPSLEDRHGGPSKSVRALANAQAVAGENVELLTTQAPGLRHPDCREDAPQVHIFPRETPLWLCRSRGLSHHLETGNYDCIHSHALWLLTLRYARAAAHRSGAPLVISPRGMLSGWAYEHRRWRKRLAELLVHPGAFAAAAGWHATSTEEADDIRRLGFRQPICVSPNGVALPTPAELTQALEKWRALCPPLSGRRVALFYSRFHRKKRVRELVDLWCARPRGDWFLLLVGVPEDYNVGEINGWIAAAGATAQAAAFDGTAQPAPFAAASLFLLPSHSENFGLVIAEALAAGVPALVTDTTPWRALATEEAGWCVPWSDYAATLDQVLARSCADLAPLGQRARAWAARDFAWPRVAALLTDFYRQLPHA